MTSKDDKREISEFANKLPKMMELSKIVKVLSKIFKIN
jgi:hypothetical protein